MMHGSGGTVAAFPPNSRLFVVCGRFVSNEELEKLFSNHGSVVSVRIALDRSNKSRGFAFIQYSNALDAKIAIEKLHGTVLHGHTLKVSVAHATSPKGKKKDILPSGKRARDDRGDKPPHASKRTGSQPISSDVGDEESATNAIVQAILSDLVQQVVDQSSGKSSLKRKDSETSVRSQSNKRQPVMNVPKRHSLKGPATSSYFTPNSKLFVTSIYEYTHQELHAMFQVYGDFDHIQMVHCQGKLHTMAYVQFTKISTAMFVLESFADDKSLLSVTLADEVKQTVMLNWIQLTFTMPTQSLTALLSQCAGMEFMDIPVASDTGAIKGRANVKFATEYFARTAFDYLRGCNYDIQSLQLISDPTSSYDVDIRAVESQFAHLMSSPYYPATPPPPSPEEVTWLYLSSTTAFNWHTVQNLISPGHILDMVMDQEAPAVFEAWVQIGSAKQALFAMSTLLQSQIFNVSVARQPPLTLRHSKKAKRLN